jgi:hypothetical protein
MRRSTGLNLPTQLVFPDWGTWCWWRDDNHQNDIPHKLRMNDNQHNDIELINKNMTLSITPLSIMIQKWHLLVINDTKHNYTQDNPTNTTLNLNDVMQNNAHHRLHSTITLIVVMLSIAFSCCNAEWSYVECYNAFYVKYCTFSHLMADYVLFL